MPSAGPGRLPLHGFVLAGGRSSRMGRDKAMLPFGGQPLVAIALRTLQVVCTSVSIAGNREDLAAFAPVVPDDHPGEGPGAGLQAGLAASTACWSLFVPVDTPRLRADLLRPWAAAVLAREQYGVRLSYLVVGGLPQPAMCLLHRDCLKPLSAAMAAGTRRLEAIFAAIQDRLKVRATADPLWIVEAESLVTTQAWADGVLEESFTNVNTPDDLVRAEQQDRAARDTGSEKEEGFG